MHIHGDRKFILLHSMRPEYIDSKTVFARPAVTTDLQQLFSGTSNELISLLYQPGISRLLTSRQTD